MAASREGARLTEQHRLEQQQVRNDFLAEFIALWVLLDSARLDDTGPGWVRAVLALVRRHRLLSAQAATDYFFRFQAAEAPRPEQPRLEVPPSSSPRQQARTPEPSRPSRAPRRPAPEAIPEARQSRVRFDFDDSAFGPAPERRTRIEIPDIDWGPSDRAATVSLIVTGPVGQKSKASRGKPLQVARDESLVEASGAAARHVLTGGRQSLLSLVQDDQQVKGWIRVTDGDPCAFCAMLASRGPVFKEDSFSRSDPRFSGPGEFKAHDHCCCTMEVVYMDSPWPGRAREFQKLWNDNIRGNYSGKDAIRAFRRLYEQMQRDARRTDVA